MDQNEFTEVYSLTTGRKQRIPVVWLDDPVLGRDFRKTPSQRELDGELPPRPTQESTVKEIDKFADKAGIDLASGADKDAKLAALEDVFAASEVQAGLVEVEPPPVVADPLSPEVVAQNLEPGDPALTDSDGAQPLGDPQSDPEPDTETPAAGDKEN